MADITVKQGHTIKLEGRPDETIVDAPLPDRVAVQPPDFRFLRPRVKVKEGEPVKAGTPLFESKDDTRVVFVSPASGKVAEIKLGARRRVLEIIIERDGKGESEGGEALGAEKAAKLERKDIIERLLKGGLWPLIRQRPFSCIADPDAEPVALFVSAMSGDPIDPRPEVILQGQEEDFFLGLEILKKLSKGETHLCISDRAKCKALTQAPGVRTHRFSGPAQAGSAGVQIYHVHPPSGAESVWYVGPQTVLMVARYFRDGKWPTERIVAVGGPGVKERKYFRTRFGASVASLTQGGTSEGAMRFVSGGVLTGRAVPERGYVGFYDRSLTVLPEGRFKELLSFMRPGFGKYSLSRTVVESFFPKQDYALHTNRNGGLRNFVMTCIYKDICPVDIMADQLAKCLLAGDIEEAEKHGVLDCAECGLCSFICPSKTEIGTIIENGLGVIRKGG